MLLTVGSCRTYAIPSLWLLCYVVLVLYGSASGAYLRSNLTVLWTYPSPISDFGFSYSIDRGRLAVEEDLNLEGMCASLLH